METVAGIFSLRKDAEEAVRQVHSLEIPNDRIALLTPGMNDERVEKAVPTADSEQPGMGQAMGGTVGGAMGVAGGASLGAAAASLLVPGVGPVIAGGLLGAAITFSAVDKSDEAFQCGYERGCGYQQSLQERHKV